MFGARVTKDTMQSCLLGGMYVGGAPPVLPVHLLLQELAVVMLELEYEYCPAMSCQIEGHRQLLCCVSALSGLSARQQGSSVLHAESQSPL